MNYQFPIIRHIDDVIRFVENHPDFGIYDKGDYTVINYNVSSTETFPKVETHEHAVLRECRGLIFDRDGDLVRRAYHKFFNVGEREETLWLNFGESHAILEKLDGSMITPLFLKDEHGNEHLRWATKAGITDISMQAELYISQNPNLQYESMAHDLRKDGYLPIFEWCSWQNRVVIDHLVETLVLTGIRHNLTGTYVKYEDMCIVAADYHVPVVKTITVQDVEEIYKAQDTEGVVIRFADGHMAKVKSEWYVQIHRAKDNLSQEKRIVEMLLNGTEDDVIPFLPDSDKEKLLIFRDQFWTGFNFVVGLLQSQFWDITHNQLSRKDFALNVVPTLPHFFAPILFKMMDKGVDIAREETLNTIRRNLGSQKKVDSVRHLWNGVNWRYATGVE